MWVITSIILISLNNGWIRSTQPTLLFSYQASLAGIPFASVNTMTSLLLLLTFATVFTTLTPTLYAIDSAYPSPYGDDATTASCNPSATINDQLVAVRREVYGDGRIIDITHRIEPDMPLWLSSDGVGEFLWFQRSIKNGSHSNLSGMKLFSVHTGTHVDAPSHFYDEYLDAGFDTDTLDLEVLNGPALLVDVPRDSNITAEVMKSLHIPKGVIRVLFRTLNTDRRLMWKKEFDTSYVGFMADGAQWLVENTDIKLIGLDYLSVGALVDSIPVHHTLLRSREIILVEGLKLDNIQAGVYTVHCLPIRVLGAEGSPIRCILVK